MDPPKAEDTAETPPKITQKANAINKVTLACKQTILRILGVITSGVPAKRPNYKLDSGRGSMIAVKSEAAAAAHPVDPDYGSEWRGYRSRHVFPSASLSHQAGLITPPGVPAGHDPVQKRVR